MPWAGFCGQEPFSLSLEGEALPPSLHSLGGGGLGRRQEEGGGSWCKCLLQRKLPPGLLCLSAPSHLSLPRKLSVVPQALCELPARGGGGARGEEDGGGGGDGDSWADLGPWGEELLTQEKLGGNSRAGDGKGNYVWE